MVRVTDYRNGHNWFASTIAGRSLHGRIIDITPAAARQLGFSTGQRPVTLSVLSGSLAGR